VKLQRLVCKEKFLMVWMFSKINLCALKRC